VTSLFLLLRRIRAFIIRDFLMMFSYRFEMFLSLLWILIVVTTLFFISQLFPRFAPTEYAGWRDPFLSWVTGMAMLNYFMTGFSSLANAIRSEQMQGTLESVLLTPINVPTIVLSSSAWSFVQTTFYSVFYFLFAWLFFKAKYPGSLALTLLFLVLTTGVLACFGILSASFAMVFKRGDPFAILLGTGSGLFSGVFFPTQLINKFAGDKAGFIPQLFPTTHGLDAIRRILLENQGFADVQNQFIILAAQFVILLPFALWIFGRSIAKAKREGSLIQF
jgi:ABC-2 type transport system permease protein